MGVGQTASGVTSQISNYITHHKYFLTDTIGFDDNRFEPETLAREMRRVLRASRVGFTHIVIVLPLGRNTSATRIYLCMLKRIFGKSYKENLLVFISKCDNGTTIEDIVEENKNDPDVGALFVELLNSPRDGGRRIVAGSLICHRDLQRDRVYYQDRMDTLNSINGFLQVDLVALYPPAGNAIEMIRDFLEYVTSRFCRVKTDLSSVLKALKSDVVTIRNYFPVCNICMSEEYTMDNKPIQLQCGHIFHAKCVEEVDSDTDSDPPEGCLPSPGLKKIKCPNCTMSVHLPGEDLMTT